MTADDHPEDISVSLTQIDPVSLQEILLFHLPYGSWDEESEGSQISVVLKDLPLEASYRIRVDDLAADGIVGSNGTGHLEVYHVDGLQPNVILETLLTSDGNYAVGFETKFQLSHT